MQPMRCSSKTPTWQLSCKGCRCNSACHSAKLIAMWRRLAKCASLRRSPKRRSRLRSRSRAVWRRHCARTRRAAAFRLARSFRGPFPDFCSARTGMAERRAGTRHEVCHGYVFDRLFVDKLQQAYELLAPDRARGTTERALRTGEQDEGCSYLRPRFGGSAEGEQHDRKPDRSADRLCTEPRLRRYVSAKLTPLSPLPPIPCMLSVLGNFSITPCTPFGIGVMSGRDQRSRAVGVAHVRPAIHQPPEWPAAGHVPGGCSPWRAPWLRGVE